MINQTAIITGASGGIGKTIALKLADLKYNTIIVGRNTDALNSLREQIEKKGVKCHSVVADLSLEDTPAKIIDEAITTFGRIDILVNNAGIASLCPVAETSAEEWDRIFKVNARAPFFLCQQAIPHLKKSTHPVIINIGSVVGFKGYQNQSVYASSKHALTGFTKVLAKEVQKDGIRVHLISPGGVNTEMVQTMRPDINAGELIQPEDIADLVEFIVSRLCKGTIDHFYIRRESGLAFD